MSRVIRTRHCSDSFQAIVGSAWCTSVGAERNTCTHHKGPQVFSGAKLMDNVNA